MKWDCKIEKKEKKNVEKGNKRHKLEGNQRLGEIKSVLSREVVKIELFLEEREVLFLSASKICKKFEFLYWNSNFRKFCWLIRTKPISVLKLFLLNRWNYRLAWFSQIFVSQKYCANLLFMNLFLYKIWQREWWIISISQYGKE